VLDGTPSRRRDFIPPSSQHRSPRLASDPTRDPLARSAPIKNPYPADRGERTVVKRAGTSDGTVQVRAAVHNLVGLVPVGPSAGRRPAVVLGHLDLSPHSLVFILLRNLKPVTAVM